MQCTQIHEGQIRCTGNTSAAATVNHALVHYHRTLDAQPTMCLQQLAASKCSKTTTATHIVATLTRLSHTCAYKL